MNIRENYLCACKGKKPEWIPDYMQSVTFFTPQILKDPNVELYGMLEAYGGQTDKRLVAKDCYGIPWELDEYGPMVSPGTCLFEEIDDWRGHFLIPEPDGYDWDRACEEDSRFLEEGKAVQMGFYGPFTQLYNAMGFENAMIAVAEDPDRVSELFGEMTEFLCEITRQVMKRVRIDSLSMYDDIANANSLFISRKCYQELVMPYHKRLFDTAKQMNPDISLEMHCCGKCEQIVPDFVDIGTNVWQPAQVVNNLKGLRERFGTKLVFNGAWDNIRVFGRADITEEQIRQSVRDSIDCYGQEGGLIFWNQQLGTGDEMMGKLAVIDDELSVYGRL